MNLFTERLKSLLAENGKTQNEVCKSIGIQKQKLSKWKTGYNEPSLDDLLMLSKYFDVTVDYLIGSDFDYEFKYEHNNTKLFHREKNSK